MNGPPEGELDRLALHLVSPSVDPTRGGLEQTALRVAGFLADGGAHVILHGLRDEGAVDPAAVDPDFHLPARVSWADPVAGRARTAAPLEVGGLHSIFERGQLEHLFLRAAVRRARKALPDHRHLLLSLFSSDAGFIAQTVAREMGMVHLTCLRGSDFSRDARDRVRRPSLEGVLRDATAVASNTHESAAALAHLRPDGIRVVLNSVRIPPTTWTPPTAPPVHVVSDTGFWFKKGSHLLLDAVATLREQGLPVTLTLAGSVEGLRTDWWLQEQERFHRAHPGVGDFPGWLDRPGIEALLASGSVYASATLGEGSSLARASALMRGMPIVSTRCGELPHLVASADRVALAEPADGAGFTLALERTVRSVLAGDMEPVPPARLAELRKALSPEREAAEWRDWVGDVVASEGPGHP